MNLQPPHLELNFYFSNKREEGFQSVLNTLIDLGASYHNEHFTTKKPLTYILLDKATGLVKRGEILQYATISEEASQNDHPPIQLITSGAIFDSMPSAEKKMRQSAKKVYRRFIKIIEMTNPSYASVTFEYDMECPSDLERDPKTIAFSDFYIDKDFIGHNNIEQIRSVYTKGFIEAVANGLYISCWRFNPKGKKLDKSYHPSEEQKLVAKLIAQTTP